MNRIEKGKEDVPELFQEICEWHLLKGDSRISRHEKLKQHLGVLK